MLYKNQLFRNVALGDRMKAFVRRITEDHRIDLTLSQQGYREVKNSAEILFDLLTKNGGSLPINDNSDPAKVSQLTQMSKKLFKRSLGVLMKSGVVKSTEDGIQIIKAE